MEIPSQTLFDGGSLFPPSFVLDRGILGFPCYKRRLINISNPLNHLPNVHDTIYITVPHSSKLPSLVISVVTTDVFRPMVLLKL